jgi:putative IMPACT (imprinted ancient) family translation regulator
MNNTYYVLQSVAKFQFKEKGSKLIAHAIPVATEEAKQPLAELCKKYYDATHYCYTYTVGCPQVVIQ